MKKILTVLVLTLCFSAFGQNPGDTIKVKAFKYGSTTRDTLIQFPTNNLSYERIIMKYNMRCKNNLISNQNFPNQGCGEWDYSCNTFIVDSSRIENAVNTTPSHLISGFTGTLFPYVNQPVHDYYNFLQNVVVLNNIISESQYTLGVGTSSVNYLLKTNERSGRSQIIYTAAELTAAGLTPGSIHGIIVNVSNGGGTANFMKLGVQHTTLTALNSGTVITNGYSNVYNSNYTFTAGNNRIQFHTPFVWNGADNLILDFSFTNTQPGNPIVLNGTSTPSVTGLYSNNNYAFDLSALGHTTINPQFFNSISNEITITFWAYGTASLMPMNTSILYGYAANSNQRQLNIHLPWSNNDVYFDCGFANNGYDRINATATATQQGGQWNHWAFTKNAVTGDMKIYHNGTLFASGTAKTKTISLLTMILGKDNALLNNYKGKVNQLTVWNKELSAADIQAWRNKNITNAHPFYGNLVAYYKLDEGTGSLLNDAKNAITSTGTNVNWNYDRGHTLSRMFSEASVRPNVVFLRGSYNMTTNTVTVKDSIARHPNTVQQFSITNNSTVTPMAHDAIVLSGTNYLYAATTSSIYNGDTGSLTGTAAVVPTGSITITNLNYTNRYPYYNEIMSFVTPYGKGLSLGATGKTWYYDLTDFTPLLKGPKRLLMTMGGEWQEQMDIDFWFIVGTPQRNVVEYKQLWQGGARIGGPSIGSITSDNQFKTLTETINNNAVEFKMRSTITGHGSEGEFGQNGGQIYHKFNINGGADEFSWTITQECSKNVIYPQGGTWCYDRQGWCPGEASKLKEYTITPFVTPGSTVTLDYNTSAPGNPGGDYRYIAAHQLISYGQINFATDARLEDVINPSDKVLYSRVNPVCAKPMVLVRNTGSVTITEMDIDYWINASNVKQSYHWTGSLNANDTVSIQMPIGSLWTNGLTPNNNKFIAEIKKVNNAVDQYTLNNTYRSSFTLPDLLDQSIYIVITTNNKPYENSYKLLDDAGNDVGGESQLVAANTTYTDQYVLNGCYRIVFEDNGGDGLYWWAVPSQGSGSVRIYDSNWNQIKSFNSDFGGGFEYSFTTVPFSYVSVEEFEKQTLFKMYPNPVSDQLKLVGKQPEDASVQVSDVLGRTVSVTLEKHEDHILVNMKDLNPGIYLITYTSGNITSTKKIIKN